MAHFDGRDEYELSGHEVGDTSREEAADTSFMALPEQLSVSQTPSWAQGSALPYGLKEGDMLPPELTIQRVNEWKDYLKIKADVSKLNFKASVNKRLYVMWGSNWHELTQVKKPDKFLAASTLEKTYKLGGFLKALGWVEKVPQMDEPPPPPLAQEKQTKLKSLILPEKIDDPKEALKIADEAVRTAENLITDAGLNRLLEVSGQMPLRELRGLDLVLRRLRGELANITATLSEIEKEIPIRERKIKEAPNEESRRFEEAELQKLKDLQSANEEKRSIIQYKLKNQFVQINDTIRYVLNSDTTLREKLRILFREQGITIVSILTALGMIIGVIVQAVTGGGASPPPPAPSPPPSDKSGVKDWIKQRLPDLGRLLGKLAEKAAAALPGVIGSIVSWLLSTAQKAVGWLAENLWALLITIVGMVYLTARGYMK